MTKARKQSNYRKKIAYFFFILLAINIILKLTGVSTLDTTDAINSTQAFSIKVTYFLVPSVLLLIGLFFNRLSKSKAIEAHNIEMGGGRW